MANDTTLGVKIKVTGSAEANREIGKVLDQAKAGEKTMRKEAAETASQTSKAMSGMMGVGMTMAVAAGNMIANFASNQFSALSQGVATSMDPQMTPFEKKFHQRSAQIGASPFGGQVGQAAFAAENQINLQAARAANANLSAVFGSIGEAAALSKNADGTFKTEGQVRRAIGEQLESEGFKNLLDIYTRQAKGREIAEQLIASRVNVGDPKGGSLMGGVIPMFNAVKDAIEEATKNSGLYFDQMMKTMDIIKDAALGTRDNTKNLKGPR